MPAISIIMSVYNGEDYLAETIESVLAQTFRDFELVVINDCSTDSTKDILASFSERDERVRVYPNEVNLRLPASLNRAISLSEGKYIARMDADDICLPDRFEKQFKFMEEHPDLDLSSCRFMTMKNGKFASGGAGGRCDHEALRAMLLVSNPILHPGVIAKAEVMRELLYDTTRTCTEDLELWTRMVSAGKKIAILPECLLLYRLHDKQITSTTLARQRVEVLEIQKKYYSHLAAEMPEDMREFYIEGVYFREHPDVKKLLSFERFLKKNALPEVKRGDIEYAILEILAEYKRRGVAKGDIVKALLHQNPVLVLKEAVRRKRSAKSDIEKCRRVAEGLGLSQCGGSSDYPVFEK